MLLTGCKLKGVTQRFHTGYVKPTVKCRSPHVHNFYDFNQRQVLTVIETFQIAACMFLNFV